jgi:NitT/TauT family transport system permease protein
LAASGAWAASAFVTFRWLDVSEWEKTRLLGSSAAGVALVLAVLALVVPRIRPLPLRLRSWAAWLTAFPIVLTVWEIVTAKTALLPLPFFAPPQSILEALIDDKMRLADSALHSLGLLLPGYLMGAFVGFVLGLGIGWSPAISYWGHPVLRFLGPLPATAWLPIAFFVFPSSWTASAFLICADRCFSRRCLDFVRH